MKTPKVQLGSDLVRAFMAPIVNFISHYDTQIYDKVLIRDGYMSAYNRSSFIKAKMPFSSDNVEGLVPTMFYHLARGVKDEKADVVIDPQKIELISPSESITVVLAPGENFVELPDFPGNGSPWSVKLEKMPLYLCDKNDHVRIEKDGICVINRSYILRAKGSPGLGSEITLKNSEFRKVPMTGVPSKCAIHQQFLMFQIGCYVVGIPRVVDPFEIDVDEIEDKIKTTAFASAQVQMKDVWDTVNVMRKISRTIKLEINHGSLSLSADGLIASMNRRLICDDFNGAPGETTVNSTIFGRLMDKDRSVDSMIYLSSIHGVIIETENYALIVPSMEIL